jgi:hypothetical protein
MAKGKKHTPEQIVNLLRQIEVAIANGKTTAQACTGRHSAKTRMHSPGPSSN